VHSRAQNDIQIVAVDAGYGDQPPFLAARDRRELLTSVR